MHGLLWSARYADRGFSSNKYKSYMPSIQTYIDLHSGPVFAIHWRYSSVLFQLSICLFYGAAIPILYLVALLGCMIQYYLDRFLICYFFREPPSYDERITKFAHRMMKFIAHFSLLGAWFELRSSKIFGLNENKGINILSPSHCPLILFGCLFLYRLLVYFMGWDKPEKEKHIE